MFSPTAGVKYVSIGRGDFPDRTMTFWGTPDCVRFYWHERHEFARPCRDLCSLTADELPLRIVCRFSIGQPPLTSGPKRVTTESLDGRPMFVVSEELNFRQESRLWIDAETFVVRRLDLLFGGARTTVDFTTVEIGRNVTANDLRFTPSFTLDRFVRENGLLAMLLFDVLAFVASFAFCRLVDHPGITAAQWRRLAIAAAIGYAVIAVFGVILLPMKGGHPPPIFLAIIGAYLWTELLFLAVALLGGADVAGRREH